MRIGVVTGGRADYGLLATPMQRLRNDRRFDLRIIATGQHLSKETDGTLQMILDDGFAVDEQVDILEPQDDALATSVETGRAVTGLAQAMVRLSPDLVLILGDRYEILAAALAAHILRLPIAHVAGGDVTEGAMDDAFRHSITKLSHLHFVTTLDAARRVRQLGEDPSRIHIVGSPGLDRIREIGISGRDIFFTEIGISPRRHNLLVTFHPVTAETDSLAQVEEMLGALDRLGPNFALIFTGVNLDTGGRSVEAAIRNFCADRANATFKDVLGSRLYLGALAHCDAVIGNSSSGLYEAPSFRLPTVNIGDRQKGRVRAASVIDVKVRADDILAAIGQALLMDCSAVVNPYGDGHASERIIAVLADIADPRALLRKRFFDLDMV